MKTNQQTDENHRDDINHLVEAHPAEGAGDQLHPVGSQGNAQRQDNPHQGQFGHANYPIQWVGHFHLAGGIETNPLAESKPVSIIPPCSTSTSSAKKPILSANALPPAGQGTKNSLTAFCRPTINAGNLWPKSKPSNPSATAFPRKSAL